MLSSNDWLQFESSIDRSAKCIRRSRKLLRHGCGSEIGAAALKQVMLRGADDAQAEDEENSGAQENNSANGSALRNKVTTTASISATDHCVPLLKLRRINFSLLYTDLSVCCCCVAV